MQVLVIDTQCGSALHSGKRCRECLADNRFLAAVEDERVLRRTAAGYRLHGACQLIDNDNRIVRHIRFIRIIRHIRIIGDIGIGSLLRGTVAADFRKLLLCHFDILLNDMYLVFLLRQLQFDDCHIIFQDRIALFDLLPLLDKDRLNELIGIDIDLLRIGGTDDAPHIGIRIGEHFCRLCHQADRDNIHDFFFIAAFFILPVAEVSAAADQCKAKQCDNRLLHASAASSGFAADSSCDAALVLKAPS